MLRELHENGFAVLKGGFDKKLADECVEEYKKQLDLWGETINHYRKKNGMMMRLANFHVINQKLQHTFTSASSLVNLASTFFGGRYISIYTSLFFNSGTQQPIHRDSPLFCTLPEGKFLGCWFALEDAMIDNGALMVMPRCHKLFHNEFPKRFEI